MKLPLQVSFHGIDRSEALENLIAKEVEGLHKFDADLISCRVARAATRTKAESAAFAFLLTLPATNSS